MDSLKDCSHSDNVPERSHVAHQSLGLETVREGPELDTSGEKMEDNDEVPDDEGAHQRSVKVRVKAEATLEDHNEMADQVFEKANRAWHPSRSLSPLLAAESLDDYDLPPQLMMCRRNSATFISIPRTLQRSPYERSDTAPSSAEHHRRVHRGLLQKSPAYGGLEGSPDGRSSVDLLPSPGRRTSASHLPFQSRLSVDLDPRLSRSHDDLTSHSHKSGPWRRTGSPLGTPHSHPHFGGGLLHFHTSLDVPQSLTEDDDSFDEDGDGSPPVHLRRRRRSSATVFHRQSSGVTLCVPLQHSLTVSPAETEEEDYEDFDEGSMDEPVFPSSAKVLHRRASGATLCLPIGLSLDVSDQETCSEQNVSSDVHTDITREESAGDEPDFPVMRDIHESLDESLSTEDTPSSPGTRSFQRAGSIAIPLERYLSRSKLPGLSREQVARCLGSLSVICRRFSESYCAVKGAALILPQSECPRTVTRGTHGGDIQTHLQSMFYLLRPPDTIKVAVKLESGLATRNRYMAVVSTVGRQDTEESIIVGIDIEGDKATMGLVLAIWGDTSIKLDGDGGFKVTSNERLHIFKPVSVQAMWSALQSVIKARDTALHQSYYPGGLTHTWVEYYTAHISSDQPALNEWNAMEDIESHRPSDMQQESIEQLELEKRIKIKLKEIMLTVDLEEVTSKYLRLRLEQEMEMDLKPMRQFIDEEMIVILRQMDSASEIFPFLFLGSEWNASNLEELQQNGVNHILNITREIDNFFPGLCEYYNVRVYDIETAELLKHWDNTYKFIKKAESMDSKVLVHCKMGISRSASSVIAFAMKEYGWSLQEAYDHVKKRRSCIRPNEGFWKQLLTYEGILDASKQRNSKLWHSKSVGDLSEQSEPIGERHLTDELLDYQGQGHLAGDTSSRPRSWSPTDSTAQSLLQTDDLASDASSDGDGDGCPELATRGRGTTPFLASWDDVDDLSSQSMDSLLEAAPDDAQPPHERRAQPQVVLLSYRAFSGAECDGHVTDARQTPPEDAAEQPGSGKVQRGSYDVDMLSVELLGAECTGQDHLNYLLHPDYKMELLMKQQRKHRRIARVLRLSDPAEEEGNAQPPRMDAQRPLAPAATPQVTKLRADNSWIKEVPPSPRGAEAGGEEGEEEPPTSPRGAEAGGEEGEEEPPTSPRDPAVCPPLELPAELGPDLASPVDVKSEVTESSPDADDSPTGSEDEEGDEEGDASGLDSDNTPHDIGVLQHYQKEDIPWNPGTVKRHKHDLERRLKTKSSRRDPSRLSSSSCSSSSSSSDSGSSESLPDAQETPAAAIEFVGDADACAPAVMTLEGAEVGETCTDDVSPDATTASQNSPEVAAAANQDTAEDDVTERPSSIYEMEAIDVEPGVVKRTKQEIEKRGSVTSGEIDLGQKTVQRSASLKEHSKKDRTSERRRTCTPVLRTTSSESETTDSSGPDDAERAECTVLQVGQEAVEMVEGRVKKHKRAIESRSSKSECDVITSPDSGPDVCTPGGDVTKPRSLSLPLDSEREIPEGSVRKQKQELESRFTTKPDPRPETSPPAVSARTTAKITPEAAAEVRPPPCQSRKDPVDVRGGGEPEVTRKTGSATKQPENRGALGTDVTVGTSQEPETDLKKDFSPEEKCVEVESSGQSAYPTEDIPWSIGTVRQQKEAIEKVSSGDSSRSSSKSPTEGESVSADGDSADSGLLHRTSSCKGFRSPPEEVTCSVGRSASLKERSARSELRVSLSKPIHVSQKDIVISPPQSKVSTASVKVRPELDKWSSTKEVLIVEAAPKTPVETGSESGESKDNAETAEELLKSPIKATEEKTVRDLVDIFDQGKPKDKRSDSSTVDQGSVEIVSRSKSLTYDTVSTEKQKLPSPEDPSVDVNVNPNSKTVTSTTTLIGTNRIPMSSTREPDPDGVPRKTRKLHGKSHPLSKLSLQTAAPQQVQAEEKKGRSTNPVYTTM